MMDKSLYIRPSKPLRKSVARRERHVVAPSTPRPDVLVVGRDTECHVTPPQIALDMVKMALKLGAKPDGVWCDPQCGTGNLLTAMTEAGVTGVIKGVEQHVMLAEAAQARQPAAQVENACFLEWALSHRDSLDVIVCNPPFRQTAAHMKAALLALRPGGVIVGLVPQSYDHDDYMTMKRLPPDTFSTCRVYTKLVIH